MQIHHVQFYVHDARYWQTWFVQKLGFTALPIRVDGDTINGDVVCGTVRFRLASAQTPQSPVAAYLQHHSPGVSAIALTVPDPDAILARAQAHGGQIHPTPYSSAPTLVTPWGLRHPLLPTLPPPLPRQTTPLTIDHIVLNVPQGELNAAVAWYQAVFGLVPQQRFDIRTHTSGLHSQVLTHPDTGLQLPINEPSTAHSQIQDFLHHNGGPGVQHIALAPAAILPMTQRLRKAGVQFLSVPTQYYATVQEKYPHLPLSAEDWQAIRAAQILVDRPSPNTLLLQIFTQPIFDQLTFFLELIERRDQAQGFGEGNFQALFEAIEAHQQQQPAIASRGKGN
ncbi:4-hydroxyphenylpyruvate dioxygenase family protein [Spirulina major]|uniref:4-hydroxyphenylpyruvate dioxygenase family protein n=1 Tax=Spirulina major TaxID=270636 RepID=UPI00093224DC|nr:VOC family protein [Spirulina major]